MIDLSNVEFPIGAVISMDHATWLESEVAMLPVDRALPLRNALVDDFLPMAFCILSLPGQASTSHDRGICWC